MEKCFIPAEHLISILIDYEKKYFSLDTISCWEVSLIVDKINTFFLENHFNRIEKDNMFLIFSDEISKLSGKDLGDDFEDEFLIRENHCYSKKNDKIPFVAYSYPICQRVNFLFGNKDLMLKFMVAAKENILKSEKSFFPPEEKYCISLVKEEVYSSEKEDFKIKSLHF